jgi:hypothetical protein
VADTLSEETLLLWADSRAASETDPLTKQLFLEPMVQEFVTWLRESAEEESEEEESDSDEEEEED